MLRCKLLVAMAATAWMSGCQCCWLTNPYSAAVDHLAVHECCTEAVYHPGYDWSRIGRPDWCCSPINRWLCPCACDKVPPPPIPQPIHLGYGWENSVGKIPPSMSPVIPPERSPDELPNSPDRGPGGEMILPRDPSDLSPTPSDAGTPPTVPPKLYMPPPAPPQRVDPPVPETDDPNPHKEVSNSLKNNKGVGRVSPAAADGSPGQRVRWPGHSIR